MVALFGYGLPGRVMCSPGVVKYLVVRVMWLPCWIESVPSRGGTCPVREVRARLEWCVPGREVVSCLTRGICRI